MSESYYFGQGKLWIAEILAGGLLGPWVWIGDVSELSGQGAETRVQHRESFSGVNAMVRDFGKELGMTWNATMHQLDADNVGRFTRSRMSAQIAGTVTGEALPNPVDNGDLISLDHMNVTDLVITDSATPTPATLVAGTHYDYDIFGDVEILTLPTTPAPTQPLLAAYSHGATKQAAFLAGTDKNYALKYKGINLAENGAPTPELADKLRALNDMTRRLRAAGVRIEAASPLDGKIFINAEDSDQLAASFRSEWRSPSWSTKGVHTINSVRLGGCYVCWLTPAKGLPS